MAKYLRLFQTVAEKEAATLDYPNVNYTIENDSLEILESAPVPPVAFGGLTVKYNIADPTSEVTLFAGGGGSSTSSSSSSSGSGSGSGGGGGVMPTRMIVDGNEETPINTWRFETAGEHVVQYEFEDNVIPGGFMADNRIPATEAIIGDDITEIADSTPDGGVFQTSTITSATIGDSVTSIGQDAFLNCLGLTTVTIGTGITSIGDSAFAGSNRSLASVTVNATTPPSLESDAFYNSALNFTIYVPAASVNTYKEATGWSDFSSSIQPIS